jgi:hypothetical protein
MDRLQETAIMKELERLSREEPFWINEARRVIQLWVEGEHMHVAAIAVCLKQAYENGKAASPPPAVVTRTRRTRT